MAAKTPWDGEDDEDYPGEDEAETVVVPGATVTEEAINEEPDDEEEVAEVPAPVVEKPQIPEAELVREGVTEEVAEEVQEDPDAWRNIRITNDPGENIRTIRELVDKEPAWKRAIGTVASQYARREWEPVTNEYRQKVAALTDENEAIKLRLGNIMFESAERAKDPNFLRALDEDPRFAATVREWREIRARRANGGSGQRIQVTPVLMNAASEIDSIVEDAALKNVPEEWLEDLQRWAAGRIANEPDPYVVARELRNTIDRYVGERQNGAVTAGKTAGAAVARVATPAPKPQIQVDKGTNSNVGKRAPVTTPRTNGVGKSLPKIKESDLEGYYVENPEAFDEMLRRYDVRDTKQLRDRGYVVAG